MKFTIQTEKLNQLINKIQYIIPLKPTIAIVSNFLLEASNDELILTATDLMVGVRCNAEAEIAEEGAIVLPKKFAQVIKEIVSPTVEISSNENNIVTIKSGASHFKLNGMSKTLFPDLPNLIDAPSFQLDQQTFKELLSNTSFAVSKEDTRYALTGVLMDITNGRAIFAGTDGKRLARSFIQTSIDPSFANQSVIPIKAIEEIAKNLKEEGTLNISITSDKIAVEANDTLIVTKLLSGDYPDINLFINQKLDISITLHKEELSTILRQISLFTIDTHHSARFVFSDSELTISASTATLGEGSSSMPVNYHGPRLEIAFNPGFFLDILRHCQQEIVTLFLADPYNPGIIIDGETPLDSFQEAQSLYLLMPMRLPES